MLVSSKSVPESDPRKYLTTVIGDAGVGKTTWASHIEGAYFLMTEMGTQGVSVRGEPILSWPSFKEKLNEIWQARKDGWKDVEPITSIVVDTYDILFDMVGQWVCENEQFVVEGRPTRYTKIDDVPFGKGYARVSQLLLGVITRFHLAGFGVFLLCHSKERVVRWKGQAVMMYGPRLSPSASEALINASGAVGYFRVEQEVRKEGDEIVIANERRVQQWQPTFQVAAKHRLPGFPAELPLTRLEGWQTYCQAFKEAYEKEVQSIGTRS